MEHGNYYCLIFLKRLLGEYAGSFSRFGQAGHELSFFDGAAAISFRLCTLDYSVTGNMQSSLHQFYAIYKCVLQMHLGFRRAPGRCMYLRMCVLACKGYLVEWSYSSNQTCQSHVLSSDALCSFIQR